MNERHGTRYLVLALACLLGSSAATAKEPEGLSNPPASEAEPAESQVPRAVFARGIADREPQDILSSIDTGTERIYFFTELVGLSGHTVRHRWEYQGEVVAEIPFTITADRWRTYSSKRLLPEHTGSWTVSVVDESGRVIRSEGLTSALAGAQPDPALPAPAAFEP